MDHFRAITLFERAAAAGSFQRVAVELAISPQAVGKAVRQLETHLGVRLFHRTTRSNSLTAEGRAFLEAVRPGLATIAAAVGQVRATTEQIEGPIRITAAHSARKVLTGPLAEFNARYPQVRFDLLMDDGFTDIAAAQIDVGFRAGGEPTGQLIARRLFGVQEVLCASPAYLVRHGLPRSLGELAAHRCTGFRQRESGRLLPWQLMIDGELRRLDVAVAFCANDPEAELDAVLAGMGIGLIDGINAAAALRDGRLQAVLTEHAVDRLGFYVYYAQRTAMPRRVRAFIDFIVERLQGSEAFRLRPQDLARTPRQRGRTAGTRRA
ncbi:MAG: LysR family transcriptional regulator [Piscinibacter sp.]|nr:LysR family transcriptional regulator [Piscinibacter sp.]